MTMTLIESKTLGTAAASIEFTSIPQTFTDLAFVFSCSSATAEVAGFIRFNGDSGGNYLIRKLLGFGSGVVSQSQSSAGNTNTAIRINVTANGTGAIPNNGTAYIPNYTGATTKSVSVDSVTEINATNSYQSIIAGLWNNTSAITSISLTGDIANLNVGSTISLYGILKGSDGIVTTS
jgi:hypothetical protein